MLPSEAALLDLPSGARGTYFEPEMISNLRKQGVSPRYRGMAADPKFDPPYEHEQAPRPKLGVWGLLGWVTNS